MSLYRGCLWAYYRITEDPKLGVPGSINCVDCRTQWLDFEVQRAVADGIDQVVVVAAGFDTRAYRLRSLPQLKFFEVDRPEVIRKKRALVDKALPAASWHRPIYVPADLSRVTLAEALGSGTGFDRTRPALFLVEGLVYYLPVRAVHALIQSVADLAEPGSRLCFDFLHLDALEGRAKYAGWEQMRGRGPSELGKDRRWHRRIPPLAFSPPLCADLVAGKGEPMVSGFQHDGDSMAKMLRRHGLELTELLSPTQMLQRFMPDQSIASLHTDRPAIVPYFSYTSCTKPGYEERAIQVLKAAEDEQEEAQPLPKPGPVVPEAATLPLKSSYL